jgi:hypothetical protein
MKRSTVLVILLVGDAQGTLEAFLKSVQAGMEDCGSDPEPQVLVLYCCREDGATQFELQRLPGNAVPANICAASNITHSGPIEKQIQLFFQSVGPQIMTNGGPVYVMIGGHGKVGAGLSSFPITFSDLLQAAHGFISRLTGRTSAKRLHASLPPGVAFELGTATSPVNVRLDDLRDLLGTLPRRPLSLVLHCCSLSCIEALYTVTEAAQLIAWESELDGFMDASKWMPSIAKGELLENLSQAAKTITTAGIITSCTFPDSDSRQTCINALSRFGEQLTALLPANAGSINSAWGPSGVSTDGVDLEFFCVQLGKTLSSATTPQLTDAIAELQGALDSLIHERVFTQKPSNSNPTTADFRGISAYLPALGKSSALNDLPDTFCKAADGWFRFLEAWAKLPPT